MIDQDLHKVCPECAGEYRLDVDRCADCGAPLVYPEEIAARDARELRPSPWLILLRTAPIAWIRALAADLDKQGIPYRIDRRQARSDGLLTLSVRAQDRQAAKEIDRARWRIEEPEAFAAATPARSEETHRSAPTFKVCPRCGSEYRLETIACADCGSALVFPEEAEEGDEAEGEQADEASESWAERDPDLVENLSYSGPQNELPPSDDLVCVCCRGIAPIQLVSQALDEARIPHRLDPAPFGRRSINCLYVLPADGDRAAAIDEALWSFPLDRLDSAELTTCPACGKPHPLGARVCGGCGLVLGAPGSLEATCARCGAVVGADVLHCPNCAAPMPRM